jgi:hypothetical protein
MGRWEAVEMVERQRAAAAIGRMIGKIVRAS